MNTVPPREGWTSDDIHEMLTNPIYFIVGPIVSREQWVAANLASLNDPNTDKRRWLESLAANIETLVARAQGGQL